MKKISLVGSLMLLLTVLPCSHLLATGTTEVPESEPISTDLPALLEQSVPAPELSRYAQGFNVYRSGSLTIAEVNRPFPGATEADTKYYVLYPREQAAPSVEGADQVIGVPVERFVSMSTTFLAHLEKIGSPELVTAVDSLAYVYSPTYESRSDAILEVGSGPGVDVEQLLVLDPGVILVNSFGGEFDAAPTLERAELPVVVSGDWLENTPLGRAEWFVFTALFADKAEEAAGLMSDIADEYERLALLGRGAADQPLVLINAPFQGTWSIAGGQSYAAQLIRDAGGDYVYGDTDTTGALFYDLETVFAEAGQADIWINPGQWTSLQQAAAEDSRFAEFRAFELETIYNNNARVAAGGGIDYFESGAVNPHVVLQDLIAIFHPELLPDHDLFYYQRLQ